MEISFAVSRQSYCKKRQVGATIVKDNNIVSIGYNGTAIGAKNNCEKKTDMLKCSNCKTIFKYHKKNSNAYCPSCHSLVSKKRLATKETVFHAEENAILQAAKNGKSTKNASIFVTTSPCINCARLIVNSGIGAVYFYDKFSDLSSISFLKKSGIYVKQIKRDNFMNGRFKNDANSRYNKN